VRALVSAWKAIDETTWAFTLRNRLRFHDGQEFGAEEVVAALRPGYPTTLTRSRPTRAITETIIVDPCTVRSRTIAPYPLLSICLSLVEIISRRSVAYASTSIAHPTNSHFSGSENSITDSNAAFIL
jgi:MarR-like DNA-binding transcriptional regulator SgrR of sgrS sRNA